MSKCQQGLNCPATTQSLPQKSSNILTNVTNLCRCRHHKCEHLWNIIWSEQMPHWRLWRWQRRDDAQINEWLRKPSGGRGMSVAERACCLGFWKTARECPEKLNTKIGFLLSDSDFDSNLEAVARLALICGQNGVAMLKLLLLASLSCRVVLTTPTTHKLRLKWLMLNVRRNVNCHSFNLQTGGSSKLRLRLRLQLQLQLGPGFLDSDLGLWLLSSTACCYCCWQLFT